MRVRIPHPHRRPSRTGATYALASQAQRWWTHDTHDTHGPNPVDLPAVVLWGTADRTHHKAATDPEGILGLLPRAA